MAIVSINQIFPGRGGEDNITRKRKHTVVFEVLTNSFTDDEMVVAGPDSGLPRLGQPHPFDFNTWLTSIQARQSDDSPFIWYVTCEYSTDLPDSLGDMAKQIDDSGNDKDGDVAKDGNSTPENPCDRQPVFKISWEQSTEPMEEDWLGNPVLNSAGDPFDPPLEHEVSYKVIDVTKNFQTINHDRIGAFQDAINNAVWRGNPPFTCRVVTIGYESASENNVSFWRFNLRVKKKGNGKTWLRKVIDRGYREAIPQGDGSTKKTRIQDATTGAFPAEPQLLDGHGRALTPGNAPVFLTVHDYPELDFSQLNI